jgi:hypothetical protein
MRGGAAAWTIESVECDCIVLGDGDCNLALRAAGRSVLEK